MESSAGLEFSVTWQRPRLGEVDCAVMRRGRRSSVVERCMVETTTKFVS